MNISNRLIVLAMILSMLAMVLTLIGCTNNGPRTVWLETEDVYIKLDPNGLSLNLKDLRLNGDNYIYQGNDMELGLGLAGANSPAHSLTLPSSPSVTYDTNTYILLWDRYTGDLVATAGGSPSSSITWANADIATAAHTNNTEVYVVTIPPLDPAYEYGMTIWSGTNYSNADTLQAGPMLYNPLTGSTYTDTNPLYRRRVATD